jgi:hypothetical protein
MWISGIELSNHEVGRVYAVLNGARFDRFEPLVYASENFGHSWVRIGKDLPLGPANVLREDPTNEDVLYLGTDLGLYISTDRGGHFESAGDEMPVVPVHDVRVQPEAGELVVATHGRSIYTMDVSAVQMLNQEIVASPIHAFNPDTVWYDREWGNRNPGWTEPEVPNVTFVFWSGTSGTVDISVLAEDGTQLVRFERAAKRGLNYVHDDLCVCGESLEKYAREMKHGGDPLDQDFLEKRDNGRRYLPPGDYEIRLTLGSENARAHLTVWE